MTIKKLLKLQESLSKTVDDTIKDLTEELQKQKNPNYIPINSFMGIVKFSALQKSKSWAPEYFIPEKQAEIVSEALTNATLNSLCSKICDAISTESIKLRGTVYKLNPNTVEILKKYYET